MKLKRKGPGRVVSLHDVRSDDRITESEAAVMAEQQATAWEAERIAHDMRSAMERRLRLGARWDSTSYYWDADLRMVRSVKGTDEAVGE